MWLKACLSDTNWLKPPNDYDVNPLTPTPHPHPPPGLTRSVKDSIFFLRAIHWEKLSRDIVSYFCGLGSEMVENRQAGKKVLDSLLMDLDHNQQQHPTVHSGGVNGIPCRSATPPIPLTFCSPSAFCGNFLWTLFFFVENLVGQFF